MQPAVQTMLGDRLHRLRRERGLTLKALAARSGVSKSMISLIERGESSPTAGVLDRLAAALGVPIPALFPVDEPAADMHVRRRSEQPVWCDPASGYLRRSLSPTSAGQIVLSEVELPPGATVGFANGERLAAIEQQVLVLAGELVVEAGAARHGLAAGDCVVMSLGQATRFINETAQPVRYLIATSNFGAISGADQPFTEPGLRA